MKKNSLRAVNLLFFIVLLLQASNLLFTWMPQYVRLTLNQALFVFLPAYLFLRLTRQPVLDRVRWRWPGWKTIMLALLLGMGLYPISALAAVLLQTVLVYSEMVLPQDILPTTTGMGLLAILAYAVMAPLCEEFLFRGVIQPVYERRGSRFAVVIVGFLFIVFHLSLLQGLSIAVLALALGWVNWRTRSLPASISTHFGANILASLVLTQEVFASGIVTILFSGPVILAGVVVASAAFYILARTAPRPEGPPLPVEHGTPDPSPTRASLLSQYWPVAAALLLYLVVSGMEFSLMRYPERAAGPLSAGPSPWDKAQTLRYDVLNVLDEKVGEGECQIVPQGAQIEVTCSSEVRAYQAVQDASTFLSEGGQRLDQARWQAADGRLISGRTQLVLAQGSYRLDVHFSAGPEGYQIRRQLEGQPEETETLALLAPPRVNAEELLAVQTFTWPFPIAGADLQEGQQGLVVIVDPHTWRQATQDQGPQAETALFQAAGIESVRTAAGEFNTWKVTLGKRRTAWFAADGSLIPVMFTNGIETWALR